MPFNNQSGTYTPVSGATTAIAGATIASATWNSIHSDEATALSTLGGANLIGLNGGIGASWYAPVAKAVNFAASAGSDIATFSMGTVAAGLPGYRVISLSFANASASLNGVFVSLYTAANGGGAIVVGSTSTIVTSSLGNTSGSAQLIIPASGSTIMFTSSTLYLHITTSTSLSTTGTADAVLKFEPYY